MRLEWSVVEIGDQDRLGEGLLKIELPEAEEYIVIGHQYGIKVNEKLVPFANEKEQDRLSDKNEIKLATGDYMHIQKIDAVEKVSSKGTMKGLMRVIYHPKQ